MIWMKVENLSYQYSHIENEVLVSVDGNWQFWEYSWAKRLIPKDDTFKYLLCHFVDLKRSNMWNLRNRQELKYKIP